MWGCFSLFAEINSYKRATGLKHFSSEAAPDPPGAHRNKNIIFLAFGGLPVEGTNIGASLFYIYRVDPCIKCTRSKLDTGQGVLGLVAPEDLLSVCCLVLPLVLSSVVLSPLVSSCLGFSALVSSCVVCWASPWPRLASGLVFCCLVSACIFLPWLLCSCVLLCRMLGLPWAFFGPLPGLSWDPFCASARPFCLLGFPWVALGLSWGALGVLLGWSWRLLALSWAAPGPLLAPFGLPVGPLGALLGALGPLVAAKDDFPRHL